ncbi:succinyldiaminopimelate transaminase [Kineosporia sp. NBRC 101677]|uniref:succinyldiaminopimelate transaminase n=1 Tax=Kineosporia sp. NBRC 101677 TaxID=3032197 RepID=UPI0024A41F77|nr:succinyldiaminopimelate transaminase [Kineosporia sp. NBRC 101677]GLY14753.1 succinyldiaminopimelate transaminase [Kineosporia sp. NBRC 101677]
MAAPVLPDFPWDRLTPFKNQAGQHPGGIVDLSVGTPVDPTPELVRQALADASDAPGYPQTFGTPPLREAVAAWFARRRNVPDLDPAGVLPTIGSKELVAWLPTLLGLGPGDVVMHPQVAYPTYDVGARLAGATPLAADGTVQVGPGKNAVKLLWLNSPGNPTGRVLGVEHLRKMVAWARSVGAVVASDECYAELGWDGVEVPSILDPEVCGGSHEGLLAVYSTSKQSNLAGYRAAFVAGDPVLVQRILEIRKHAGMIVPWPVQEALRVALGDDEHVAEQRERYRRRREVVRDWLRAEGFKIDYSEAGLYFWATRDEPCWDTVADLAARGVLVTPGDFYGPSGARHVRVALTVSDERVAQLAARAAGPDGSGGSTRGNLR